jgi:hypothetical protein
MVGPGPIAVGEMPVPVWKLHFPTYKPGASDFDDVNFRVIIGPGYVHLGWHFLLPSQKKQPVKGSVKFHIIPSCIFEMEATTHKGTEHIRMRSQLSRYSPVLLHGLSNYQLLAAK